ncbi:MAG: hypothetical protein JRJ26_07055 [Deltaproteobacteria bacterium]|nr:hypothetical protein [Deltaproteobacteria bacterium]
MNNLEKALSKFLNDSKLTGLLAQVLACACEKGRVSYHDVERIANDSLEDVLLLGSEWRLLLPVKTLKSGAWEDRLLPAAPGDLYEVPNIIKYLLEDAGKTGSWNSQYAIIEVFREMGEPAWERMPRLVEGLWDQARDYRITVFQIEKICCELGLGDRVDTLIAELKGSGVMSPKLGSLAEVSRTGMPIYEVNPSLFVKEGERQ